MKIAFLFYDRVDYRGGPTINALRLLPQLRRCGHDVHALVECQGAMSPCAADLEAKGISVCVHPIEDFVETRIEKILETLKRVDPDVFIPNSSVAGWYSARWVREAGIPTIAALRNDDSFHWAMVQQFVSGQSEWAVSGLVCVSHQLCEKVRSLHPAYTKLAVIPSGVPLPATVAEHSDDEPLRLIYVGRLIQKQKRIRDLVDALIKTVQCVPGVTATLYGQNYDNERERIEAMISAHGLQERICINGVLKPSEMQEVMTKHHVVILLSDYEGTPGSLMDGMACGLVPISLDIEGGVRELVLNEQTGLLVSDRDKSLVDAVKRLKIDIQLRKRLARNARKHITQRYSLAGAVSEWERFCASLVTTDALRRPIVVPWRVRLPTQRPEFAREDNRQPRFQSLVGSVMVRSKKTTAPVDQNQLSHKSSQDQFLKPVCVTSNLDRFLIRKSVLSALSSNLDKLDGLVLDVGCGEKPYKSLLMSEKSKVMKYIGLDFKDNPIHDNAPDIFWENGKIPLREGSVDCAICTEVFEHCPEPESVMKEIYRVLKPGGILFFTVPFLWPLHEVPFDEYRYTPFALERHLRKAGFNDVEIAATGGWDASLAQMLGLWVRRRPMGRWKRSAMSCVVYPIYCWLVRRDRPGFSIFKEQTMFTGLSGTARKTIVLQ